MFVVLGASGNTGKVVAETLLRQKKKVRVVLHDAAKGRAWREAGADVAIADVDEGAALERAFSDAEGVYVLLPPNFSSSHVRVDNNRRTNTIAAALVHGSKIILAYTRRIETNAIDRACLINITPAVAII
jgi:uncharacterized protein YbjT (DUF2867 family)